MHDLQGMKKATPSSGYGMTHHPAVDHDTSQHFSHHKQRFDAHEEGRSCMRHHRAADYGKRTEELNYMKTHISGSGYGIQAHQPKYDRSKHFDEQHTHTPTKKKSPNTHTERKQHMQRKLQKPTSIPAKPPTPQAVARRGSALLNEGLVDIQASMPHQNQQHVHQDFSHNLQQVAMPSEAQQHHSQQPVAVNAINQHFDQQTGRHYYHNILTGKTGWLLADVA